VGYDRGLNDYRATMTRDYKSLRKTDDAQALETDAVSESVPDQPSVPITMALPGLATPEVRRDVSPGSERDPLGDTAVESGVAATLSRRQGTGSPLPESVAQPMGDLLGADLSGVRVHADSEADRISRSMQATAFTYGQDVYFTSGTYAPDSSAGQRLLAHEMAHVTQNQATVQRSASSGPTIGRADDPAEAEADARADRVLAGLRQRPSSPASAEPHHETHSHAGVGALRRQAARFDEAPSGGVVRRAGFLDKVSNFFKSKPKKKKTKKPGDVTATATLGDVKAPTETPETTETVDTEPTVEPEAKTEVPVVTYPRTVIIGKGKGKAKGESVELEKEEDEEEAERIFLDLETTYGIKLSSPSTIEGIKKQYSSVLASELAKLQASTWKMKELRTLQAAIAHYAPILGKARAKSTVASKAQGVTSVGKLVGAIDRNSETGKVDQTTMGEYFGKKKNVGLFDTVTDLEDKRYLAKGATEKDNLTTLEANAIHEMAHGLIQPLELTNWINTMDFWTDRYTPSGAKNAEEPPTPYGQTGGAAEDLCESVAIFFTNQPRLKAIAPVREAFLAKMVAAWTPAKKKDVVKTTVSSKGATEDTKTLVGSDK
jgi:hypothetical protein